MPSDSHEQQQLPSVSDTKANEESQSLLNSDEIRAGTKVPMTHAQRQVFLKTSSLGQVFGVSHLLPEVAERKDAAPEESPCLKRVRGLFKRGKAENAQETSSDTEVAKNGN